MENQQSNNYPKLHNASWPGVVGKGEDSEPPISLDTMIELTAKAEVDGIRFDGFDLFLLKGSPKCFFSLDKLDEIVSRQQSTDIQTIFQAEAVSGKYFMAGTGADTQLS